MPLTSLEALWLGNNDRIGDAGMHCVGRFSSLNALDVGSKRKITDAGIAQLQNLKHIYDLRLRCNGMTDAGMAHLQRLRQLGYLHSRAISLPTPAWRRCGGFPGLLPSNFAGIG